MLTDSLEDQIRFGRFYLQLAEGEHSSMVGHLMDVVEFYPQFLDADSMSSLCAVLGK